MEIQTLILIAIIIAISARIGLSRLKLNHVLIASVALCIFMNNTTQKRVKSIQSKSTTPHCHMIRRECERCRDATEPDSTCNSIAATCAACEMREAI